MDIKGTFTTDKKAEKEGKWFFLGDARLKIASSNATGYLQEFLQSNIGFDKLTPEQKNDRIAEAMAKHILIDWEGVTENEKEVPYSVEKATEYLKLTHFQDKVFEVAKDFRSFIDETVYTEAEEIKKP